MLPLIFFTFTLAVLPLVSTRVAAVLLIFTYLPVFFFKIKPSRRALTFSILATIALITASLTSQNLPTPLALLQWLVLIWSVPLFSMLIGQYGCRTLITIALLVITAHAVWGIGQFIVQRDLGLTSIGESKINIHQPAVAKIDINFSPFKLLRAYGPYKHANSHAGVLVLGVSLISLLPRSKNISWPLIFFSTLALALATTFSRAAIFSFFLLLIFNRKIFFKPKYFLLLAILVLTFTPLMVNRFTRAADKATPERINSVQWAGNIIKKNNYWQGTGIGQYSNTLKNYLDTYGITYQPWQIDFVHSVPLLIIAEWGIVPILFLLLGLLITNYGLRLPSLLITHYSLLKSLLALTPILLTDHYFATQLAPAVFLVLVLTLHLKTAPTAVRPGATVAPKPTQSPKEQ